MTSNAYIIETHELGKRYGNLEAVESLNLRVQKEQITGFLGRNGAGKSTTIKMLLGVIHATTGTGKVLGWRIDNVKENCEMRRHIAYVSEDKQLYAFLTVGEMIEFTKSFYSDWRQDAELRLLEEYGLPLQRKVRTLSKGMRTKLALLLALARRPELLILDEPSEGLDPVAIEELLQALAVAASEGTTVFFSSHQIAEVERIADQVCILDHGRLVAEFSLDRMRQNYRRVTASFAAPPRTSDFKLPGVTSIRAQGRQISLIARHGTDAVLEHAQKLDAVALDVTPMNLREVFLEMVKERE